MKWDLTEPQCLTTARLMVAAPEFVYEQLKFYGDNTGFGKKKPEVEAALLARNDKLINLALAQFACDGEVVKTLYARASSEADEDQYNLGLRVACLSNRNVASGWSYFWRDFDLEALFAKRQTITYEPLFVETVEGEPPRAVAETESFPAIECQTFLTNPTIPEPVLCALYEKSEYFSNVDEKSWLSMVYMSAENDRLGHDWATPDEPDLCLWGIHRAIFKFLEIAPASWTSIYAARQLLDALGFSVGAKPKEPAEIENVLTRWGEIGVKEHERGPEGIFTRLTLREELRCQIAALYGPTGFGSADDPDVAVRCAFYAGHALPVSEMAAAFRRDEEIFVYAALKDESLLSVTELRTLLESYVSQSGLPLVYEYKRRCEQLHQRRRRVRGRRFDPRPISAEVREMLEDDAARP